MYNQGQTPVNRIYPLAIVQYGAICFLFLYKSELRLHTLFIFHCTNRDEESIHGFRSELFTAVNCSFLLHMSLLNLIKLGSQALHM